MLGLVPWDVDRRLQAFLEEDLGFDDITTQGLGDLGKNIVKARITAKKEGIMAGGFFALAGISHPGLWVASLLIGSAVFAVLLQFLKRKPLEDSDEPETEKELNLDSIKISG